MQKTKCVLVCDTREQAVLRHKKELESISINVVQITTGDYVVVTPNNKILAVIERKSLEDYGASIKDGRCNNKQKLIDMRAKTGCRIIYIIEGAAFPKPTEIYAGIPYKHIESSIFHLIIRDNINIIHTKDTLHTAEVLARFTISMDNLQSDIIEDVAIGAGDPDIEIDTLLTQRTDKSDHDIVRELWGCFKGISVESADEFIAKWTLADIICKRIPYAEISNFKKANGVRVSKKVVSSLTSIDKLTEIKMLSVMPGISRKSAIELINTMSLPLLLTSDLDIVSNMKIGTSKRCLGSDRPNRWLRIFNYKYTASVTQ